MGKQFNNMEIFTTKLNPNQFNHQLGKQVSFFYSVASGTESGIVGVSLIAIVAISIALYFSFSFIFLLLLISLLLISFYVMLATRFRYLSIHEYGIVYKKRFRYHLIKFEEIKQIVDQTVHVILIPVSYRKDKYVVLNLKTGKTVIIDDSIEKLDTVRKTLSDSLSKFF